MKLNEKEALRYLGFRGKPADADTDEMIRGIGGEMLRTLTPKCVYKRYDIKVLENAVELDGWRIESIKLSRHLRGCKAAYLFAANMARGTVAHSVANALIEDYCDEMQAQIAEKEAATGLFLKPRYSPGYGDFALESQKEIFARLECAKRIGLTLTDTMLMVPFKSVTAVIGVTDAPTCTYVKCRGCANTDCEFREI